MSFLEFHERGLWYPAHPFLLGLQHLNPNRVLHIAGFVMLCEGFLRIDPHVNLFRSFFHARGLSVKGDLELMPVGGSILQKKPRQSRD
jgi:hypothetical protein